MSPLERRVQLLIDPTQYAEVERVAEREGKSVSAVIRDAIGQRLARTDERRAAAGARLLGSADEADSQPVDWDAEKAAIEGHRDGAPA